MTMTAEQWEQVEEILDEVLSVPPNERPQALAHACHGDASLQSQIEELLLSFEEAENAAFLHESPHQIAGQLLLDGVELSEPFEAEQEDLHAGQALGPYRIREAIGHGGMGAVYLAERADGQFHKDVALKLVKRGMDTDEILRRFRYEREILARLEHPNIARLLDAGVADDGRPYFVMEYVEGEPIHHYCDRHGLTVRQRLKLFCTVCEAVRYAHRNLVIHRDLKPSNVLVTEAGEVKLLDFGIAKLLDDDPALGTMLLTEEADRRMTPQYAAPEQVRGAPPTPATDVYALGVMLYRLLTGCRPYHFPDRSLTGIEKIVCEQTPERPSTVVVRAATEETPETRSLKRGAVPARLRRQLQGDLDAIVMMALRKEAERRYASAAEFAEDIRRYLEGRPVEARPDSLGYRAAKFVRRHTVGVGVAMAVVLFVTALVAFYTVQLADERDRAELAAARAISTRDFMAGTFELANPDAYVDAEGALDETFTKRDLIEANLSRIDELSDPLDQAAILNEMARAYVSYGAFGKADSLFQRALTLQQGVLGKAHPDFAPTFYGLGLVARNRNDHEAAMAHYRQALTVLSLTKGAPRRLIPEVQNGLAFVLIRLDSLEAAKAWYQRALTTEAELLRQAPEDKDLQLTKAASLRGLATALRSQQRIEEAEARYQEALQVLNEVLGQVHPEVANTMHELAILLRDKGDLSGAEAYHLKALGIYQEVYGSQDHHTVGNSFYALGKLYHHHIKDYLRADSLYALAVFNYAKSLPAQNAQIAYPLIGRGVLFVERGQPARAEQPLREALAAYERSGMPETDTRIIKVKIWLGICLTELGQFQAAEHYLQESYRSLEARPHLAVWLQSTLKRFVELYQAWQKPGETAVYQARLDSLQATLEAPAKEGASQKP